MNAPAPISRPPPPEHARPGVQATVSGSDREFLPAALEVLESPPSPLPVAIMLTVCIFCAIGLGWSFIGRLDVHATAWGKIEATGRGKIVQPLEAGKVASLHVQNGMQVQAGETLIELDPSEAGADLKAIFEALAASDAETARRHVAIEMAARMRRLASEPGPANAAAVREAAIPFPPEIPVPIRNRESAVAAAELTQLHDTLADLDKQAAQKIATHRRLAARIAYETDLIATATERLRLREIAVRLAIGTKVALFDAQESLLRTQVQLASDKGELTETDAAIDEIASQKFKAISAFVADNEAKLSDATRKSADLRQQLVKARAKIAHMILAAPVNGIVQQMAVTTIGQVVLPGQQLMTIVPDDGALQIQAYVNNADIGFVRVGQRVEVKIDAFPFTHYRTVGGSVLSVAADALDEQAAKREQSNATALASSAYAQPPASPGQPTSFVFPITIALDRNTITADGASVELKPGMTVSAEIRTGSRRVIDYLWSPLARIGSEALKER